MEDAPVKPDPAPVKMALEKLGCKTGVMFGDTVDVSYALPSPSGKNHTQHV